MRLYGRNMEMETEAGTKLNKRHAIQAWFGFLLGLSIYSFILLKTKKLKTKKKRCVVLFWAILFSSVFFLDMRGDDEDEENDDDDDSIETCLPGSPVMLVFSSVLPSVEMGGGGEVRYGWRGEVLPINSTWLSGKVEEVEEEVYLSPCPDAMEWGVTMRAGG